MHNLPHTTEELIEALESKGYTVTPPKKPTGRIKILPEIGTDYWSIDYMGELESLNYKGDCYDLERFILGNMYHDKESAEKAKPEYIAWLNSTAKVLSRIAELNHEGWEAKEDTCEPKFFFFWNDDMPRISWDKTKRLQVPYYMATHEIAKKILAEMPEDVEKMVRR